jgi:hypothetical protein
MMAKWNFRRPVILVIDRETDLTPWLVPHFLERTHKPIVPRLKVDLSGKNYRHHRSIRMDINHLLHQSGLEMVRRGIDH